MTSFRPIGIAASAALMLVPASTALSQRPQPSPEQRIERVERQVEQMQRQVYPKGRPADTAGFADDPAASQASVTSLAQRMDSLERQLADILRLAEENGNLLQVMKADLAKARSDNADRIRALEERLAQGPLVAEAAIGESPPTITPPKPRPVATSGTAAGDSTTVALAEDDPGEAAYTEGFKAWEAGRYGEAITSLRAFTAAYPKHRRLSFAKNLIGRAMLDKGDARAAAQALLANYRNDPKGERAPDSLYYLGQAQMKLGQPGQACKAYDELDAIYGAKIRPDLKKLENDARIEAKC
ncbi:MAG: tetratricopeptide repeat protein [Sphingomicrobium sp.]